MQRTGARQKCRKSLVKNTFFVSGIWVIPHGTKESPTSASTEMGDWETLYFLYL